MMRHPLLNVGSLPSILFVPIVDSYWLVVSSPLKDFWKSVGMMPFPIFSEIQKMFRTTNQVKCSYIQLDLLNFKSHVFLVEVQFKKASLFFLDVC